MQRSFTEKRKKMKHHLLVTSSPRYLVTSLLRYLATSLPRYIVTSLLLLLFSFCSNPEQTLPVKVISLNARYDNPADAPHDWQSRRPIIAATVLDSSADIVGFQEVLKNQLKDLDSLLPGFSFVSAGRDDGKEKGEACPVFYRSDRFEALASGTVWLSETPQDTGSMGWDAALPRIVTWVKLKDLKAGSGPGHHVFYFLNTHFDHVGDTARLESARLIRGFIREKTEGLPVIVTGDFNCGPDDLPYAALTAPGEGIPFLADACLASGSAGEPSFNGFGNPGDQRIDFIFTTGEWEVLGYAMPKTIRDGIFISDHYPVIATLRKK